MIPTKCEGKLFATNNDDYYVLFQLLMNVGAKQENIITTFTKPQAKVARDILEQPNKERIEWGKMILNGLEQLKNNRTLRIDTMITATLKSKGGLVVNTPVQLHWRS